LGSPAYNINSADKNDTTAAQRLNKDFQARAAKMGSLGLMLFALVALVAGTLLSTAHKHANSGRQTTVLTRAFTRLTRSIRRMWIMSQVLFALCMFATAFASSLSGVYILVGLCGISWAVTIWAPFALISAQIVQDTGRRGTSVYSEPLMQHEDDSLMGHDQQHDVEVVDKEGNDLHDRRDGADDACERRPGIVLGLHNVAIAGPQIVAAASCSLIFWMLEGSSEDSVGWTLRAGGLAALGAALMAGGIQDDVLIRG
jgi:solute carrier family 45 protein 1/2/4